MACEVCQEAVDAVSPRCRGCRFQCDRCGAGSAQFFVRCVKRHVVALCGGCIKATVVNADPHSTGWTPWGRPPGR